MKNIQKHILLPTLLFLVSIMVSCDKCEKGSGNIISLERNVSSFHGVKVKGSHNLYIKQDSVQKVILEGDDNILPLLETEVKDGVLEIYVKKNKCVRKLHHSNIYITVPHLNTITLDGSGSIRTQNTIKEQELVLNLWGSGSVNFAFEGNTFKTAIDGSGDMTLSGHAKEVNYSIDGSGRIKAYDLSSNNATASIDGSGDIEVAVSDHLSASIDGSGTIAYQGSPVVQSKISGSGNIRQR